jgi:ABC-type nitrate/sulfonate/bicarbonate transport system permease component
MASTRATVRPFLIRFLSSPAFCSLLILVAFLLLLEGLVRGGYVSRAIVAEPSTTILGIADLQAKVDILGALRSTLTTTMTALVLELLVAVPLGHLMYKRRAFGVAYTSWLASLSAAPIFLLYPLFLVVFGRNQVTLIVMGFLPGVIPLILHVQEGFLGVKQTYINVGVSYALSKNAIFWRIMVPAAAPTIATGVRLALMYTLINIVAVEYLVDVGGLGRIVADRYFRFDIPGTYSAIVAVAAVSVLLNWLIGRGERWIRSR